MSFKEKVYGSGELTTFKQPQIGKQVKSLLCLNDLILFHVLPYVRRLETFFFKYDNVILNSEQ